MNKPRLNSLVFVGLIGLFTIGSNFVVQVYRVFGADQDIWWTPRKMALSIEDTKDRIRILVGGKLLQKHLSNGTLFALDGNGEQCRVVSRNISIRMNNWHKVQSSILTNAFITAFAFCIVLTVLITGLVQVYGRKRVANKADAGDRFRSD